MPILNLCKLTNSSHWDHNKLVVKICASVIAVCCSCGITPYPTVDRLWCWWILDVCSHGEISQLTMLSWWDNKVEQYVTVVALQLLTLRTIGVLLPIYIMVKALSLIQRRRNRQVHTQWKYEMKFSNQNSLLLKIIN